MSNIFLVLVLCEFVVMHVLAVVSAFMIAGLFGWLVLVWAVVSTALVAAEVWRDSIG